MFLNIDWQKYKLVFWAVFAGVIISAYSLAPQFQLWALRGQHGKALYAQHDFDEAAYAAYIQSLIDGKPRRNSPYSGNADSAENPQAESLFSIQFLAFYPIAIPARLLGLSASTAMIFFAAIFGFLAGLALFWLFWILFDNPLPAFVGTVLVFSAGALAAGQGSLVARFSPQSIYYFTAFSFARRVVPLIGFPALFLFFGCIWKFISSRDGRTRIFAGILAFLSFVFLVYSYFYLWTTAAAWFGALIFLWLLFRLEDWRKTIIPLIIAALFCSAALVPYFILLANRSRLMDAEQLLVVTHLPDLLRVPEIAGYVVLAIFAAAKILGWIDWREPKMIFLMAFALVPTIVFNQQILSGRALQPIHYQLYCVNYLSVFAAVSLAFVLAIKKAQPRNLQKILLLCGLIGLSLGVSDAFFTTKAGRGVSDWRRDLLPAARRIGELAQNSECENRICTVLSFDFTPFTIMNSDELPALSSQAVLWSPHQKVFSDLTPEQNVERLFKFIYYQNFDDQWLKSEMQKRKPELINGFFGWGRNADEVLTGDAKPVTDEEINRIVERYKIFRENFSEADARSPRLVFAIAHEKSENPFSTLDKWYRREAGEKIGKYNLYRLRLKNP